MQFLDCALLEVQTLQYKLRPLVASFMYIILGKDYGQFDLQTITEIFPTSSLYLLDKNFAYNDLFGKFLDKHFGFQLEDLLPCIQYASTFFSLPLTQHPPPIVKLNPQGVADVDSCDLRATSRSSWPTRFTTRLPSVLSSAADRAR